MIKRSFKTVLATAAAAMSLTGVLALSACEQDPYATDSTSYARPEAPAPLAGAPSYEPPPPAPVYAPPPPPPEPVYSQASPPPPAYEGPAIVAMAPIPNPGDPGSEGYYPERRVHSRLYAEGYGPEAREHEYRYSSQAQAYAAEDMPGRYHHRHASWGYAGRYAPTGPIRAYRAPRDYNPAPPPAYANSQTHRAYRSPAASTGATASNTKSSAYKAPTTTARIGQDVKVGAAVATAAAAGHSAAKVLHPATTSPNIVTAGKESVTSTTTAAAATGAPDRAGRLETLQSALTDAISKTAVLGAPDHFTANQPADVSLTVPKSFADTLHREAQKDGLTDVAASANLTAALAGEGFSVSPSETQSQPLTAEDTVFRWTVTAQPGAKGPLHADVGADLLGGGSDTLKLGSVQKTGGSGLKLSPRVIGASILVLLVGAVLIWLVRGRGGPGRPNSGSQATIVRREDRPLDMGGGA